MHDSVGVVPAGFVWQAVWEYLQLAHILYTRMCSFWRGGDKLAKHP